MSVYIQLPANLPSEILRSIQHVCRPNVDQLQRHKVLGLSIGVKHYGEPLALCRVGALLSWPPLREEFTSINRAIIARHVSAADSPVPDFLHILGLLLPGFVGDSTMGLPTLQHLVGKVGQLGTAGDSDNVKENKDPNGGNYMAICQNGLDVRLENAKEPTKDADPSFIYARCILRLVLRIGRRDDYKNMVHWVRSADIFSQIWVFFCALSFMQLEDLEAAYKRLKIREKAMRKVTSLLRKDS